MGVSSPTRTRPLTCIGKRHLIHCQPVDEASSGGSIMIKFSCVLRVPTTLTVLPSLIYLYQGALVGLKQMWWEHFRLEKIQIPHKIIKWWWRYRYWNRFNREKLWLGTLSLMGGKCRASAIRGCFHRSSMI